jgi:hypothetical protein
LEQIETLKKELAAIEGQPVPVPVELTEQDRTAAYIAGLKDYFAQMLSHEERQPALVEATNGISKCCPVCYLTQAIANQACKLCGATPESWLLAEDDEPTPAGKAAYDERGMFKRMAANATVEDLKTALRSGWATTPAREEFAGRLLELREAQNIRAEQPKAAVETKPVPVQGITDQQVKSAIRLCDLQLEKIEQEREELRAKSGQSETGQNK